MFGNKNSAVPYVRIGGVDRQSVLTSNANGNTPVKEIGVNANGNLIFSTDLATFKSVLDLKYSQFKSNDENQDDTWGTEKSVSMRASGTLEDGTAKETGVIVSKEYVAMINSSMTDNSGTTSQVSVADNDITLYSTDGNSTTYLTVTPTGATVNDKEIATTDKLPNLDNYLELTKETAQTITSQIIFNNANVNFSQGIKTKYGDNIAGVIANRMTFGSPNFTARIIGDTERPQYSTVYSSSASYSKDLALLNDVPKTLNNKTLVANGNTTIYGTNITLSSDNTGNLTDAIINANVRIDNLTTTVNGKADISAIPIKTSQLTNDSNFMDTSDASISKNLTGTTTITINGVSLSLSVSNGTLTIS